MFYNSRMFVKKLNRYLNKNRAENLCDKKVTKIYNISPALR